MKTYIIRKKVQAASIADALKKDRSTTPDEVSLADEQPDKPSADAIGFHYEAPNDSQ